jgi:hypothetical protein
MTSMALVRVLRSSADPFPRGYSRRYLVRKVMVPPLGGRELVGDGRPEARCRGSADGAQAKRAPVASGARHATGQGAHLAGDAGASTRQVADLPTQQRLKQMQLKQMQLKQRLMQLAAYSSRVSICSILTSFQRVSLTDFMVILSR